MSESRYIELHGQDHVGIYKDKETGEIHLGFDDGVGNCGSGTEEDAKRLLVALNKTFELDVAIRTLVEAAKILTNFDNTSAYFRKQGDWDRVKTRIRELEKVLKSLEAEKKDE